MTYKSFVFVVTAFCLHAGSCVAQQSKSAPLVSIKDLQASYGSDRPIHFEVKKNVAEPVSFVCAAETLVDGEFRESRWDISQNALKLAVRKPKQIQKETVDVIWDIPHQMKAIRPEAGRVYRLRIDTFSPREEHIYSSPFSITKTSNSK